MTWRTLVLAIRFREWPWNVPLYATRFSKVTQDDIEWARRVSN